MSYEMIGLIKFKNSPFRMRFSLSEKEILSIKEKGLETIERHAFDFIKKRLAPQKIQNDGKQTPFKGHPVFKAQHATATCCRGCLLKWHGIPKNKELSSDEISYVIKYIMLWIENQLTLNSHRPKENHKVDKNFGQGVLFS